MKNCPNILVLGTTANIIYFVYVVPTEKEWWLKYPEANPKEIGLEKATAHIVKNVLQPRKLAPRLSEKITDTAPCGADCNTCPLRKQYNCSGCPSTIHYQQNEEHKRL